MFNSTTFSSSRRRLQRANPSGAGEQARVISFASAAPSKIRGRAELGLYLRLSVASNPSSTSCRRVRATLLTLVSSAAEIALSLHPSPASETSAFRRMRALVSNCAGLLPARTRASSRSRSSALNFTTYFLTAISFPDTNHLRRSPRGDRDSEKHHKFNDAGDYRPRRLRRYLQTCGMRKLLRGLRI